MQTNKQISDRQFAPVVSIGVPVHNGAQYIEGCLENLLAQDHSNIIINIFENYSTDATIELLQPYLNDPRVRLHPAQSFLPAVDNFLRAWKFVSDESEFFMLIACDDRISKNYLSLGVMNLIQNPEKSLVAGTVYHSSLSGENVQIKMSKKSIDRTAFLKFGEAMKKRQFPAPFIYGVYRGKNCVRTIQEAANAYPSAWGNDRLAVRYFILRGEFLLVPGMQFYFLTGSLSGKLYGAKTKKDRFFQLMRYTQALWAYRNEAGSLGVMDRLKYAIWCFRTAEADTTYSIEKIILK